MEPNEEKHIVMTEEEFGEFMDISHMNYATYLFSDERFESKLEITNGDVEKAEELMGNPNEEDLLNFYELMSELSQEEEDMEEDQEAMINYMMNLMRNNDNNGKHNLN